MVIALAYVAGFGVIFTLLGITAAFAGGAIADYIRPLRIAGGLLLVVMGLSLAGLIRIPILERTWRPLDAGASAGLTGMTGGMTLAPAGAGAQPPTDPRSWRRVSGGARRAASSLPRSW